MKKLYTIILLVIVIKTSNAQSFSPEVIGSAGTFATSASGSMAWTIGEVITETYTSGNNFFTQGFHQPDESSVVVVRDFSAPAISIFPNPVVNNLTIDFSNTTVSYTIYIYDILGKVLRKMNIPSGQTHLMIPFGEFANGIYSLSIINTETNSISSYKINKAE